MLSYFHYYLSFSPTVAAVLLTGIKTHFWPDIAFSVNAGEGLLHIDCIMSGPVLNHISTTS